MASITTRAGKGSPLTNAELDANFNNINAQLSTAVITGGTIDGATIGATTATTGKFSQLDVDNLRLDGNTISSTDTNGNVTIAPNGTGIATFSKATVISTTDNTNAALRITQLGTGNALLVEDSTNPDSTPTVIDNSGYLVVGHTSRLTTTNTGQIESVVTSAGNAFNAIRFSSGTGGAEFNFAKSDSDTVGTNTAVASADTLGTLSWSGADGTAYIRAAQIFAAVDGTPGTNDMPGRLVFSTTADGASTPTERMRINSSGNVGIGTSSPSGVIHAVAASGVDGPIFNSGGTANTNHALLVRDSASNQLLRVNNNGNVGIGTSSPVDLLTVNRAGGSGVTSGISLTTAAGAAGDGSYIKWTGAGTGEKIARIDGVQEGTDTGSIRFNTGNGADGFAERMRLDSSGNVGIGTISPSSKLHVRNDADALTVIGQIQNRNAGASAGGVIAFINSASDLADNRYAYIGAVTSGAAQNGNNLVFATNPNGNSPAERMRIDSSGNVGIGTSSPLTKLHLQDNAAVFIQITDSGDGASRIGQNGTALTFGVDFANGATERARIDSSGNLLVGTTTNSPAGNNVVGAELQALGSLQVSRDGGSALQVNRKTDDGELVAFRQAGTQEGSISVSGTTVSYNGGHLARWAQTTTAKDESLVKGTVLSNLDEMNVYTDADGNPVDNEQLNKVKVSDVEGDANVAGVFVNWTHDDQHNVDEINMAMTGDMIIRIAQGTTVARGDLLMSAGDGTAKPQSDDIVRSKTVAKVTSTHVTCTYADGSYCVPCVLMAC